VAEDADAVENKEAVMKEKKKRVWVLVWRMNHKKKRVWVLVWVAAENAVEDKEVVMRLHLFPTLMVIINNTAKLVVPERDVLDVKC
jgi:hypothetical protein